MINWTDTGLRGPKTLRMIHTGSTVRSQMEAGNTLTRPRYTKEFEKAKITFRLRYQEFRIFKGVWAHYLANGTSWFLMDLPIGGLDLLTSAKVKFITDYDYTYLPYGLADISVGIQFEEVEVISEDDLGVVIGGVEPALPYTTDGLGLLYDHISSKRPSIKIQTTTDYYAVSHNDDPATRIDDGDFSYTAPTAMTTSSSFLYRYSLWASTSGGAAAGELTRFQYLYSTSQPSYRQLVRLDIRKALNLNYLYVGDYGAGGFKGTEGSNANTFDLHSYKKINTLYLVKCPVLHQVNVSHPETQDTLNPLVFNASNCVSLQGVSLSGWFKTIGLYGNSALLGTLDLSNVTMDGLTDALNLYDLDSITQLNLPSGAVYLLDCYTYSEGSLTMSNLRTITSNGDDTLSCENVDLLLTDVDDAAIYEMLKALLDPNDAANPFATTTITHTNAPSDGTLSAQTIALASTKNITLNPAT